MRNFNATCVLLLLISHGAWAAEPGSPAGLDQLVALAMERHPEAAAFEADAAAARASAEGAGRLMDPQWMIGAQALGAMPDSADPTMAMFGVEQMFSLPGAYEAGRDRARLEVRWAEGERARVAADVKEALWQVAARLRADDAKLEALRGQLAAAEAALALGLARYGAGGAWAGTSGRKSPSRGGEGLPGLLRLEAEVARVRADRDALAARRGGEQSRLVLLVGSEVADAVALEPARFLGAPAPEGAVPERTLATTTVEFAAADLRLARLERLPTFMIAADVRVMPDGMVDGVDAALGVTVPIWGGAGARSDAAAASAVAASRRSEHFELRLAEATAVAHADASAAVARATALREVAAPRARAAWEATMAVWSAGGGSATEVVAAWQTDVEIARDVADADLAVELARARLARLDGR